MLLYAALGWALATRPATQRSPSPRDATYTGTGP